jgi:lipopolysaccharide biosynthesis glycosyltransferase
MLDNPFTRFHQSIEDYPHEHGNMDDHKLFSTDNFERMKPLMPKKGSTVGTTTMIPTVDTDEKLIFYDTQGESLYTNPPDPNVPVIDHGLDEEKPWSFRKSNYNQIVINNPYTKDYWGALRGGHAPWWGQKLSTPAFFKPEKFNKFLKQYAIRLEFETLKLRHAKELRTGDLAQRDRMKAEVSDFLKQAEERMLQDELKDVYVTDHKPVAKKFSTLSDEEDAEYYAYVRSLEDYNNKQMEGERVSRFESGRYERGTLKQRIFEPLAGARTLENGTVFYEVSEKELS